MRTSSAPSCVTGDACATRWMNAARSDSVPSGLLFTKSARRWRSNQVASELATARMNWSLSWRSMPRSSASVERGAVVGMVAPRSEQIEMRRHAQPAAIALRVDVGVAAVGRPAVGLGAAKARVHQRQLADEADAHVHRLERARAVRPADALQERRAIADRTVDQAAREVLRQVLGVPGDVVVLGRAQVVAVQLGDHLPISATVVVGDGGLGHRWLRMGVGIDARSIAGFAKDPEIIQWVVPAWRSHSGRCQLAFEGWFHQNRRMIRS